MARSPRLKVYRTPIGFHDAYVAASSQKAALAAWGSSRDLFARGVAEQVTDPALVEEPLARPGEIVRRSRGTAAEQIAALPEAPSPPSQPRNVKTPSARPPAASPKPKPPPKPSSDALDEAAAALAAAERRIAQELRNLADEEARLARKRRDIERRHLRERERLTDAHDRASRDYHNAMARWRADRN